MTKGTTLASPWHAPRQFARGPSRARHRVSGSEGQSTYVDRNGQVWRIEDTAVSSGLGSTAWAGRELRWVGRIGKAAYGAHEVGRLYDELRIGVEFRAPAEYAIEAKIERFAELHEPLPASDQTPPPPKSKPPLSPPTYGPPEPSTPPRPPQGGGTGTVLLVGAAAVVAWALLG